MNGNPFYEPYWYHGEIQNGSLEHYGVKNMKWGTRNGPPYPLERGKSGAITKTQKKKKQSFLARFRKKQAKKKTQAKKAQQKEEAKSKEQLREELLKSTDPKFLAKHIDLLDTKEIKERLDRIDTETKLKKLTVDDKAKKNVEKGMEWVGNISKIAEATSKVAKAYTDTIDAKDKLSSSKRKAQSETQTERDRHATASKMNDLLKKYAESSEEYSDIQIEFDPKTGKMSFKSNKKK